MLGKGKGKDRVTALAEVLEAKPTNISLTVGNPALVANTTRRWKLRVLVKPSDAAQFSAEVSGMFPQLAGPAVGSTVSVTYRASDCSRVKLDQSDAAVTEAAAADVSSRMEASGLPIVQVTGMSSGDLINEALTSDPAAFRQRMMERAQGLQGQFAAGQNPLVTQAGAAPGQGPSSADPVDQLEKLADLRDRGVLTEAEFQQQKQRILGQA